jgi:hypothetical protein
VLLAGCASGPRIPFEDVSIPHLNRQSTAHLGDRLLVQARGFYTDVVHVDPLEGKFAAISAGDYCRYPDSDKYFSFDPRAIRYINFLRGTRGYGNTLNYNAQTNEVCLDDMWSGCFDSSFGRIAHEKDALCADPDAYQQVIEYNGKEGHILNFTYREFVGNRMRSPFTTNFKMDESDGDTISYKGATLKVINATNQKIDYIILHTAELQRRRRTVTGVLDGHRSASRGPAPPNTRRRVGRA